MGRCNPFSACWKPARKPNAAQDAAAGERPLLASRAKGRLRPPSHLSLEGASSFTETGGAESVAGRS